MRELKYYVACSVDGFIAHLDHSLDGFLMEGEHITGLLASFPETFPAPFRQALGIAPANKCFDTVLMGRRTYEMGLKVGVSNPYPHLKQYLFSRTFSHSPDPDVELVSTNTIEFVRQLKQQSGKDIWLCGGANLAQTLLAHNLIDSLILKVNPFLMGTGIPIFAGLVEQTSLKLSDRQIYDNGVVVLGYQIE